MESKKLQQFQQANSHLAPQKKLSMTYQQQKPPTSALEEYHRINMLTNLQNSQFKNMTLNMDENQKNYDTTSSGSPLTPIDSPPQPLDHHNMMGKSSSFQNNYHQQQQQQQMVMQANRNKYGAEQLYQTPREARAYHIKPNNNRTALNHNLDLANPVTALQQQYQQLQQAKMQAQIQTQNDALVQQQRTFALRQTLNPPAGQQHFGHSMIGSPSTLSDFQHDQSNSMHNAMMQTSNRNIPPSTLNVCSQYQPAESPLKQNTYEQQKAKIQNLYHQPNAQYNRYNQQEINLLLQQQYNNLNVKAKLEAAAAATAASGTPGDPSPVYIQQNHPGHVVNQACQTQISGGIGNKNVHPVATDYKTPTSSTEETSSVKSPSHVPAERKKSFGTIQALRSPITKRPASSSVTLSGWLYKQGSDGLKVWRKRWFVLSEYCLYYYKGPEEEKLLGSILLPSYKVSACLPEDKIYRKFAFKCEHTNMRTYWLAAENSEQMYLWVRAMMAATLMQASSESDHTSQPSSSSVNHSGENSDSGIHTFQSQQNKLQHGPVTPASDMGGMQPLYANAPPKPRRITDGGYSSPSPEILIDSRCENNLNQQGRTLMSPSLQQRSHQAIYDTRTGNVTSKLRMDNSPDNRMMQMQYEKQDINYDSKKQLQRHGVSGADHAMRNDYVKSPSMQQMVQAHSQKQLVEEIYGDKKLYVQRPLHVKPQNNNMTQSQGSVMTYPNVERRTPDAYGRSSSRFQGRYFSDYEDIYNIGKAEHLQSIPADVGYRRPLSPPTYNSQKIVPPMPARYTPNHLESNAFNKYLQTTGITRPHSADFLEYEVRAEAASDLKSKNKRAPRPKSSLDINRGPDSYYYSEESYAEKMRQSALYLQKPQHQFSSSASNTLSPLGAATTMPASYNHSRNSEFAQYSSDMNSGYENPYGRTTKETEMLNEAIRNKASASESRINRPTASSSLLAKDYQLRLQQSEQFLRSASARLPKTFDTSDVGASHFSLKDGERKREESMKRLLEWKQRMLQSPLTRKGVQQNGSPSIMKLGSNPNILSSHGAIQKTRSDIHSNVGYNSYSSDDEDGPVITPAGRSTPPTTVTTTPSSPSITIDTNKSINDSNSVNISNGKNTSPNINLRKLKESLPLESSSNSNSNISINSLSTSLLVTSTYVPVYKQKTLHNQTAQQNCNDNENLSSLLQTKYTPDDQIQSTEISMESKHPQISDIVQEKASHETSPNIDSTQSDNIDSNFQTLINDEQNCDLDNDSQNIEESELTCEYTDDDLDEALAESLESSTISVDGGTELIYENGSQTPTMQPIENHYLPMTPKKSVLSCTNSLPVLNNISDAEENPYVEMTKGIYEESSAKSCNYEIVCISSNHYGVNHQHHHSEPVYMELAQAKNEKIKNCKRFDININKNNTNKLDTKKKSKKFDVRQQSKQKYLPDILKASQNTAAISDSSDADDESSKDIVENTKLRSRSRFSLSDTFRPASYYLGTSTPLENCAESSDSEIVSPPPIPTSPPPLELELNTEEIFLSENYDTVKRKDKFNLSFDQIPKIHSSNSSLSLNKTEGHKSSRLSLPDQLPKFRTFKTNVLKNHDKNLSDSNYSFHTSNSSNTSSDFDLYNKLKINSPSFSGDDQLYKSNSSLPHKLLGDNSETDSVDLRNRFSSDSELERQRSRRPLSEDSISEIDQISEQFEETITTDLDAYLSRLRTNDICSFQQPEINIRSNVETITAPLIKPPEIFRNESDTNFYGNISFVSSTDSLQNWENEKNSNSYNKTKMNDLNELNTSNSGDTNSSILPLSSSIDIDVNSSSPSLQTNRIVFPDVDYFSNDAGHSSRETNMCTIKHKPYMKLSQTLNNKRDININVRATEISHIHNPISRKINVNEAINMENHNRANSVEQVVCGESDQTVIDQSNCLYIMPKPSLEKNISKGLSNKNLKSPLIGSIAGGVDVISNNSKSMDRVTNSYSFVDSNIALTTLQSPLLSSDFTAIQQTQNSLSKKHNIITNFQTDFNSSTTTNPLNLSECDLNFSTTSSQYNDSNLSDCVTKNNECSSTVIVSQIAAGGEQLWEEDNLWRESLRKVSQRHAKSLDDLDRIPVSQNTGMNVTPQTTVQHHRLSKSKISRDAIYVNDNVSRSNYKHNDFTRKTKTDESDSNDNRNENDVYVELVGNVSSDVYEVLREDITKNLRKSTEIDRETIRQWDSMSSGLMKNTSSASSKSDGQGGGTTIKKITKTYELNNGNIGANNTTTKNASSTKQITSPNNDTWKNISVSFRNMHNITQQGNLTVKPDPSDLRVVGHQNLSNSYYSMTFPDQKYNDDLESKSYYPIRKSGSRVEIDLLEKETSSQIRNLDMSAGDLLSRTHEELVLLLIQLRRENSQTARAIEQCCTDIHEAQNSIRTTEGLTRAESIQRLDYLKQHLLDLEKQYEKSKPLVNLVDNMVKLGSLYRNNENANNRQKAQEFESAALERLDFNQRIQERRLFEEEQKRWDRLSPNQNELQSKVNQLYYLDQLLQEESGTLQTLQKDKENLERALSNLRSRLQVSNDPPLVLEAAKKQQHILERELSRVHQLLAENSKKLEQTVAGNARLEEELLILRQKLQSSKSSRGSQTALAQNPNTNGGDSIQYASSTAVLLESELRRVQQLVGDMQRQRLELSQAVSQLTANSNRLYQEIGNRESAKNCNLSSQINKRYNSSCWTETDLDSMKSVDHTSSFSSDCGNLSVPLYVDTNSGFHPVLHPGSTNKVIPYDNKNAQNYGYQDPGVSENNGAESDELLESNPFTNLSNQEKQEIKTVRIVKRESERRHRDRERSGQATGVASSSQNLEAEEQNVQSYVDDLYCRSKSLPRTPTDILCNQNPKFVEKRDSVNANDNYQAFPSNLLKKSVGPSRHSHGNLGQSPVSPVKYPDYFSLSSKNSRNPYPVSMTDKNRNFSSSDIIPYNDNKVGRTDLEKNHPASFTLRNKTESIQSLTKDMDPVFQSEAARQIINEMSGSASEDNTAAEKVPSAQKQKRAVPREKRRHFTTPNNVNQKAMQKVNSENDMNRNNTNWRARDDLDMEVALRPRMNAPDVVRSALGQGEKISENTIDRLFGAPNKILIPERYIPEKAPELSSEEKKRRQEKVEAIKKMLSEAPMNSANETGAQPTTKITAEKKQREHLLQLNQILAQQVMQMSKIVAEKAMSTLPSKRTDINNLLTPEDNDDDNDTLSPTNNSLPSYQQRNNFFT